MAIQVLDLSCICRLQAAVWGRDKAALWDHTKAAWRTVHPATFSPATVSLRVALKWRNHTWLVLARGHLEVSDEKELMHRKTVLFYNDPFISELFFSPNIRRQDFLLDFMKQAGCWFQLTFSIPQRSGFISVAYEWYNSYKVDPIWGNGYRKIPPIGSAGIIIIWCSKSDMLPWS